MIFDVTDSLKIFKGGEWSCGRITICRVENWLAADRLENPLIETHIFQLF